MWVLNVRGILSSFFFALISYFCCNFEHKPKYKMNSIFNKALAFLFSIQEANFGNCWHFHTIFQNHAFLEKTGILFSRTDHIFLLWLCYVPYKHLHKNWEHSQANWRTKLQVRAKEEEIPLLQWTFFNAAYRHKARSKVFMIDLLK